MTVAGSAAKKQPLCDGAVRATHWLIVLLVAACWWTAENGDIVYHTYCAYGLLDVVFIALHIVAIAYYLLWRKQNLTAAMFHGRANVSPAMTPVGFGRLALGVLLAAVVVWLIVETLPLLPGSVRNGGSVAGRFHPVSGAALKTLLAWRCVWRLCLRPVWVLSGTLVGPARVGNAFSDGMNVGLGAEVSAWVSIGPARLHTTCR